MIMIYLGALAIGIIAIAIILINEGRGSRKPSNDLKEPIKEIESNKAS